MHTQAFLGMVLPGTGRYCAVFIDRDGGVRPETGTPYVNHRWFDTVQELADFYERITRRGKRIDCYHAVASYSADRRKKDNVERLRSLFFDLDCGPGKPFADQRAAISALASFADKLKLPCPIVVSSGGGIHAYWVMTRDLTRGEWQPLADALKATALAEGLAIDAGITGDCARILRTPGTTNQKAGKLSQVLHEGDGPVTPGKLASALSAAPAAPKPQSKTPPRDDDFFGTLRDELPKADAVLLEQECEQVRAALADPDSVAEPLWYKLVGLAAYTTGGAKVAMRWSEGHEHYDPDKTVAKMEQWQRNSSGPPTCKAFAAENRHGCRGCPHRASITTPVQIVPPPPAFTAVAEVPEMLPPPKPYFIEDGQTWVRTSKVENGNTVSVDELVYRSVIFPVRYYQDPDSERDTVEWQWVDEHKVTQTKALLARVTSGGNVDFRNAMADVGIASLDEVTAPLLKGFMNSSYQELRAHRPAVAAVRSLGWQDGYKAFALGSNVHTADGVFPAQLGSGVTRMAEGYAIGGDMANWLAMTAVLEQHKMFPQQIAIGIGMASVLMPFTGLSGAVVAYYGPTGTGKTTAENIQQAVWGDPAKLVRGAKATSNALYGNFSVMGNMPVALDEASRTVVGNLGELLYSISVGAEKERMDASGRVKDRKQWCLIAMLTGNQSFAAQLASAGDPSDAQHRRLLELEVLPNPAMVASMEMGKRLQSLVYANHGHIGPRWVKALLALGEDGIRELIDQAIGDLAALGYVGDGTDRFHITVAALIHLSLTVAYQQQWIAFNPRRAVKWMLTQLTLQKARQAEGANDHFDLINLFLNHHALATISATITEDRTANTVYSDPPRSVNRNGVVARYERHRKSRDDTPHSGVVYISRTALAEWLVEQGSDLTSVINGLDKSDALVSSSARVALAGGTPLAAGRVRCIAVQLNHPRMEPEIAGQNLRVVPTQRQPVDLT